MECRVWQKKMWKQRFLQLHSEPCAYMCSVNNEIAIITIWVDDLLLFSDSAEMIKRMKKDIWQEWNVSDMGDPMKIVGIEIVQMPEKISIQCQKWSIENILKWQGLTNANPVQMPLDPNVKILPNPDGNKGIQSNSFAELLRELQYIANAILLDIGFMVN